MNTYITLFDDTGRITLGASVTPETLPLYMVMPGSKLVGVCGDPKTQYVESLALVEYTEAEQAAIAALQPGWVWQMPERIAVDMRDLVATRAAAYAKCFTDINAVVWDAVGNMTEEYKDAEAEARAYVAAGYPDTVPEMVACYADKESQTGPWAADDIIARADAFQAAKVAMRTHRMARQKDMTSATTLAQLDTAASAWSGFIVGLRAALGLPGVQ